MNEYERYEYLMTTRDLSPAERNIELTLFRERVSTPVYRSVRRLFFENKRD